MKTQVEKIEIGFKIHFFRSKLRLEQRELADKCNKKRLEIKRAENPANKRDLKDIKEDMKLTYDELATLLSFKYFSLVNINANKLRKRFGNFCKITYLEYMALKEVYKDVTGRDLDIHLDLDYDNKFHQSMISLVESGQRTLRIDEAYVIVDVLDVSLEDIAPTGLLKYGFTNSFIK